MRLLRCCLLLLAATVIARAADAEFVRVWPGWRDADSFDRISEFFGGAEDHRGQIVLRTQSKERGGFYFLTRVRFATKQAGAKFIVQVIRPDSPEVRTFTLPIPGELAGDHAFQLGLTGADWPRGAAANPVAWRLSVVASDGRVLTEHKSYLWEKPAK